MTGGGHFIQKPYTVNLHIVSAVDIYFRETQSMRSMYAALVVHQCRLPATTPAHRPQSTFSNFGRPESLYYHMAILRSGER